MNVGTVFGLVALTYSLLYLADTLFRTWNTLGYIHWLRKTGLEIGLLQIRWCTNRFNQIIRRFGNRYSFLLSKWFTIGAVVSSLLIIPSIYILIVALIDQLSPNEDQTRSKVVIQPVLPGVNIPNSELGYYFVSLLVCTVYHELGHAVSASSENVQVLGFGVFVLFLLPAAFVDLPTDQLMDKSSMAKLRVFSAGVWHNLILVFVGYLISESLPWLVTPLYTSGVGPCVTHVVPDSPVTGPSGLKPGDALYTFSGQEISNKEEFKSMIVHAIETENEGYCLDHSVLESITGNSSTYTSVNRDCCRNASQSLCFNVNQRNVNVCVNVRTLLSVVTVTNPIYASCDGGEEFIRPILDGNSTKFIQIQRKYDKDFLFVGNPALIYTSTEVSDYCPRLSLLPRALPDIVNKLCKYTISFSSGLAVLNVIPSLLLDGQHMIKVLLEMLLRGEHARYRDISQLVLTSLGTGLVVSNILLGLYSLLTSGVPNVFSLGS